MLRGSSIARYEYKKGKAIVFGSEFVHSTEPGSAGDGREPHAYLSFTFGSDDEALWPLVASAVVDSDQSRILASANGTMVLSALGEAMRDAENPELMAERAREAKAAEAKAAEAKAAEAKAAEAKAAEANPESDSPAAAPMVSEDKPNAAGGEVSFLIRRRKKDPYA